MVRGTHGQKVSAHNARRLILTGDHGGKRFVGTCKAGMPCLQMEDNVLMLPRACPFKFEKVVKIGILRGITVRDLWIES